MLRVALTTCFILAACQDTNTNPENVQIAKPNVVVAGADTNPNKSTLKHVKTGPDPAWANQSEAIPVPDDATGLIFSRRNDVLLYLDEKGESTYRNQRFKLLATQALEAGNLALTWNPESGSPTIHRLLIHRDGEVIDVLANNKFEVIRREDQLEQSMLTGFFTAMLRVPDLRVGDELEWAFTSPSVDPTLGSESFGLIVLDSALQSGLHKIGISWKKGQKPTIKSTQDLAKFEERTPQSYTVTLKNPKMITPPKDAPPRYNWQRVLEYSDFKSWPEISKRFNGLYVTASQLSANSEIKTEAKRIAKAHSEELEQAKAALKLVQQQVRYIYVGMNGGNYRPATADETWLRRYGDCKGKTAMLKALLAELNIKAEVMMASNSGIDEGLNTHLPNPALFDHVLLRTEINGTQYWLDPTLPDVIEPSVKPFMPYRWVLPLSAKGVTLEPLQQKAFAIPQEMGLVEYDARAGFDKPARKVSINVQRGIKGLGEYMQYSALTSEQIATGFRNALTGTTEWDSIEDASYRYDKSTQASILTIIGTGMLDWDDEGGGVYDLTLPGGGFSPPSRRQRVSGKGDEIPYYSAPSFSCHVTTVRLPKETKLENWSFNSTYTTKIFGSLYSRKMQRRDDRTIRMVRTSRVEHSEITPRQAQRDNNRLASFDSSMARIEHNPNKPLLPTKNHRSVTATYEIDWISPSVPCLYD